MLVLGLSGSFGLPGEQFIPNLPVWFFHDSAACIVRDGVVISAIEEERVNRIKHTNMLPAGATEACLQVAKATLADLDAIAYFFSEEYADNELDLQYVEHPHIPLRYARELITTRIGGVSGVTVPVEKLFFIRHHQCHATAAYLHSGFDSGLISVLDGNGEYESVSIFSAHNNNIELLTTHPPEHSLGHFYCLAIELLGYSRFDEYKVMGLAPYGDATVYRDTFRSLFTLSENGYRLDVENVRSCFLRRGFLPRRRGESFRKEDADFAAGLQETLEAIAGHILSYWAGQTGHSNLCLAGGVAHNCTLNGRIAASGRFKKVFVHPAAHDAGAAVGAALEVCRMRSSRASRPARLRSVDWGSDLGSPSEQKALLDRWTGLFLYDHVPDAPRRAAEMLADGKIVAWAQGRMEFGPRALGNRSIVADARPYQNRERINSVIKKREGYRPFAPAVLAERVHEYFEVPPSVEDPRFMTFTVPVRIDKRSLLGAVTHIDGSARVQSVDRTDNPRFWSLVKAFEELTAIPVVLNTSFNTSVEPIVRTSGEALVCFLTTTLDCLFLDDWMIRRREMSVEGLLDLIPLLDPNTELQCIKSPGTDPYYQIVFRYSKGRSMPLSENTYRALSRADGERSFRECIAILGSAESDSTLTEFSDLLAGRFVKIRGLNSQ